MHARKHWPLHLLTALLVAVGCAGLLLAALIFAPHLQPTVAADHGAVAALAGSGTPPPRPNAYDTLRGLAGAHWHGLVTPAHAPGIPAIPAALCKLRAPDCLTQVRRDPAAAQATLQTLAPILDRVDALPADAVFWAPAAETVEGEAFPAVGFAAAGPLQRAWMTRAALSFIEGHAAQGMAQACGIALRWRALRRGSNDVVIDHAGMTFSAQALQLMTQMAARLPSATPLPDTCEAAMAPPSNAGLALCAVAHREAAWAIRIARGTRRRGDALRRWYDPASIVLSAALIDMRNTTRGIERAYAWACAPDLPQRLRAGDFTPPTPDMDAPSGLACIGNVTGCAMLRVLHARAPLHGAIAQRATFIAQLAALRQWTWLRAHAPASPQHGFAAYGELLRARAVRGLATRVESGDLVLDVPQGKPAMWRLPLPRTGSEARVAGQGH